MSSFFTLPASQRKRKRAEADTGRISKKKNRGLRADDKSYDPRTKPARKTRDESISGSESDEAAPGESEDLGDESTDGQSDHADETAAERRVRLAERYLENVKDEVDEAGYDAADIDRDLIAERLKEDVVRTSYSM